jgi:hypothetical protein
MGAGTLSSMPVVRPDEKPPVLFLTNPPSDIASLDYAAHAL